MFTPYHLQPNGRIDNPDQRIAEDINQFTNYVLTLLQFHDDVLDLAPFIPLRERVVLPLSTQFSGPAVITGSL